MLGVLRRRSTSRTSTIRPGEDDAGTLQEGVHASRRRDWRKVPETFVSRRMLHQEQDETIWLLVMLSAMMHPVGARDGDVQHEGNEHTPGGKRTQSPPAHTPQRFAIFSKCWKPHHVSQSTSG